MHSCTHWLRPPPRIWAHIGGRYWSAKMDDISEWPPSLIFVFLISTYIPLFPHILLSSYLTYTSRLSVPSVLALQAFLHFKCPISLISALSNSSLSVPSLLYLHIQQSLFTRNFIIPPQFTFLNSLFQTSFLSCTPTSFSPFWLHFKCTVVPSYTVKKGLPFSHP